MSKRGIRERVSAALQTVGKTANAASLEIGYRSRNAMRELLDASRDREITGTMLIRLHRHYRINPNWILLGEGPQFLRNPQKNAKRTG